MPQGLQSPLRGIRSPFGAQAGSRARRFAKGKPEVISWAFDDPVSDMGSVWIKSVATPSLDFNSSASAAILAKFTGWSATSPMTVRGRDGTLKHAPHNRNTYSNAFGGAPWTRHNVTALQNADGPDGTPNSAWTITDDATLGEHRFYSSLATLVIPTVQFIKAKAGTANFLGLTATGISDTSAVFDLTTGEVSNVGSNLVSAWTEPAGNGFWKCFIKSAIGATYMMVRMGTTAAQAVGGATYSGTGKTIIVHNAVWCNAPVHSYEDIVTGANAVYSIPTTYDTSGNKLGFLSWEARTNAAWWSRDLTQSAHVRTNSTAYKTARGTDEELNSASRLVATAANGNVIQTITATSAQRVSSAKVRRSRGSGTVKMSQGETTGSEKVTNGTFDTDASGWTALNSTLSSVSGSLRITKSSTNGQARQAVTVVVGKLYKVTGSVTGRSATAVNVRLQLGTGAGGSDYTDTIVAAIGATTGSATFYLVARTTSLNITLYSPEGTGYEDWDNISVLECTETSLSLDAVSYAEVSGTELVSNTEFDSGTNWSLGSGHTISGGAFNFSTAGYTESFGTGSFTQGKLYKIVVDATSNSAGFSVYIGSGSVAVTFSTTGVQTAYIVAGSSPTSAVIVTGTSTGAIASISVKEVSPTQAWTEAETAAATITNPCVAIWCATSGDAIDVDHVQCEVPTLALAASPPIITAGAAVTRAACNLNVARSLFNLNGSEGTLVVWGYFGSPAAGQYPVAALIADGNNDGFADIYSSPTNTINANTYTGASTFTGTPTGTTFTPNALLKTAYRYKANDFAVSVNGAAVQTDGAGALPTLTASHSLTIGSFASGARSICGVVSRLLYVAEGETNAELQARAA